MRKSLIAQSVAAMIGGLGLVGAASAAVVGPAGAPDVDGVPASTILQVNTDGLGHINVVPYYSVQNGNDTYINITNTDTRNAKAVKVRFRAASNSDDVFDFTLLLSPGDVWGAAITKGADGLPVLVTNDKSCTLPNDISGASFVTARLNPAWTDAQKATEASEGYVEILNMADIPPETTDEKTSLFESIKHVGGVPRNCASAAVADLFNDSDSYADALDKGLEVPTTGLMTNWTVINVAKAAAFTGAATAVEARVAAGGPAGYGNIVLFPQAATPVITADARDFTSDPLLRGGLADNTTTDGTPGTPAVSAAQYDFPDLSTPYLNSNLAAFGNGLGDATRLQAVALSQALAVSSVANEYVTDPGILAKTDWIFSMPTRRYNVARNYAGGTPAGTGANVFTNLRYADDDADLGGVNFFTNANTSTTAGQICVTGISIAAGSTAGTGNRTGAVTGDREERFVGSSTEFVISPGVPTAPLSFCGEVSVLSFNAAGEASVLGAAVAKKDLTVAYTDGWVRIATPGLGGIGLPIIGSAVTEIVNSAVAEGTAGNFGQTFPHRATRPVAP